MIPTCFNNWVLTDECHIVNSGATMRTPFRIALLSSTLGASTVLGLISNYTETCKTIANSISKDAGVYYWGMFDNSQSIHRQFIADRTHYTGHHLYHKGNGHWASSSSQDSACVVEPANAEDVSTIVSFDSPLSPLSMVENNPFQLRIVANDSAPFGIRSGGHATNAGFSSTPGVQIALFKLSEVTYHQAPAAADGSVGTVDFGSGLVWDDVYAALQPHGVNVVGGRVTGVGVGGFTLGGGYSWLSNQYGLYEQLDYRYRNCFRTCSAEQYHHNSNRNTEPRPILRPKGQVWGGLSTFTSDQLDKVIQASTEFAQQVKDPKAAIIPTFNFLLEQPGVSLLMFYDGPTPPSGIFERFQSIPHFTSDVKTRSFTSLVQASPANTTYGLRAAFNTVSLKNYSQPIIEQVLNQSKCWGKEASLKFKTDLFISYDVEPFLPTMNARSKGGAYPHDDFLMPLNLYFGWVSHLDDKWFHDAIEESTRVIREQAIAEGQDIAGDKQIKYGNYASANEDLSSDLKKKYDPNNVMNLAGGYRF
ncbi:putative FAD dependent oxidoreductase [Rhizoctonia solani AG-1 IA]|uniref:Putative FAD dependent oxidoreductase n=1 Tax=Thanatephorus cucumeris (strain AG1-IA) TaxID=983506 RepID=L8WVY9_THACA|nr:putative FAD dependent oxidoreductase [Rhizoctonia solani AG-1 IA]